MRRTWNLVKATWPWALGFICVVTILVGSRYLQSKGPGNIYNALDIPPYSNISVIKRAYRKWTLKNHPDKRTDVPEEQAQREWLEFNEQYEYVTDPKTKRLYDFGVNQNLFSLFDIAQREKSMWNTMLLSSVFLSGAMLFGLMIRLVIVLTYYFVRGFYSNRNLVFMACSILAFVIAINKAYPIDSAGDSPIIAMISNPFFVALGATCIYALIRSFKSIKRFWSGKSKTQ